MNDLTPCVGSKQYRREPEVLIPWVVILSDLIKPHQAGPVLEWETCSGTARSSNGD